METREANTAALSRVSLLAIVLLAAGCGFRLAGIGPLPAGMERTYLETEDRSSEFFSSLREALRRRGAEIVERREQAGTVLTILEDSTDQRVLSVTARNVPREYEVFYAVTFALESAGERILEPQSLVATRAYAWDERQVLGKTAEERILRQSLADDLARRVIRRIEASRRQSASPAAESASGQSFVGFGASP